MPIRLSIASGSLIGATVITAVGLNLAVMGLGADDEPTEATVDDAAAELAAAEVALTSAQAAVPVAQIGSPVLAVAVPAVSQAAGVALQVAGNDDSSIAMADDDASDHDASDHDADDDDSPSTDTASTGDDDHDDDKTVPSTKPPATNPPTTQRPTTRPPTTAPTSAPTTAAPPVTVGTEYLTYEFEGIASIIVARHPGNELEFWSVDAEDGWVYLVEDRGPDEVKIKFRPAAGGDEAEFEVKFEGSRLKVKREY